MEKIEQARRFKGTLTYETGMHAFWMVGGAVRDMIRGVEPKDIDFATPFEPDKVKVVLQTAGFFNRDIDMKDAKLGIVRVKFEDTEYEITTFRKEVYTPGSRTPKVEFTGNIYEDASRRDFNVNAIYWNCEGMHMENFYDPFRGIRPNDANEPAELSNVTVIGGLNRLREDPLRVLRYLRIAQMCAGSITPLGGDIMDTILGLSHEKIRQEMEKGFKVQGMYKVYREAGVFNRVIPFYYEDRPYIMSYNFPYEATPVQGWEYLLGQHVARPHQPHAVNVTILEKVMRMMNFDKDTMKAVIEKYLSYRENSYLKPDWKPKDPIKRLFGS